MRGPYLSPEMFHQPGRGLATRTEVLLRGEICRPFPISFSPRRWYIRIDLWVFVLYFGI